VIQEIPFNDKCELPLCRPAGAWFRDSSTSTNMSSLNPDISLQCLFESMNVWRRVASGFPFWTSNHTIWFGHTGCRVFKTWSEI